MLELNIKYRFLYIGSSPFESFSSMTKTCFSDFKKFRNNLYMKKHLIGGVYFFTFKKNSLGWTYNIYVFFKGGFLDHGFSSKLNPQNNRPSRIYKIWNNISKTPVFMSFSNCRSTSNIFSLNIYYYLKCFCAEYNNSFGKFSFFGSFYGRKNEEIDYIRKFLIKAKRGVLKKNDKI